MFNSHGMMIQPGPGPGPMPPMRRDPSAPATMAGNTSAWVAAVRGVTEGKIHLVRISKLNEFHSQLNINLKKYQHLLLFHHPVHPQFQLMCSRKLPTGYQLHVMLVNNLSEVR